MLYMACRNRVRDFAIWKREFEAQRGANLAAGLVLRQLGRGLEDPQQVFFVFEVGSLDKAKAFIADPKSREVGERAGVIDGEYHFVETLEG